MRGGNVCWVFLGGDVELEADGFGRGFGLEGLVVAVLVVVFDEEEGGRAGPRGGLGEEDVGLGVAELGRDSRSIVTAKLFCAPAAPTTAVALLPDAPLVVVVEGLGAEASREFVGLSPRNIALFGRALGWGRPEASLLFGAGPALFDVMLCRERGSIRAFEDLGDAEGEGDKDDGVGTAAAVLGRRREMVGEALLCLPGGGFVALDLLADPPPPSLGLWEGEAVLDLSEGARSKNGEERGC